MHLTQIRHVDGDTIALKRDLQTRLGVEEKEVTVNQVTGHVLVKGHHMKDIKVFFEEAKVGYREVVELLGGKAAAKS